MELVAIITILALLQFVFFGIQTGKMRAKHGVKAPDIIGDPEFMRMSRVTHQFQLLGGRLPGACELR